MQVSFENVEKSFDKNVILEGISFSLNSGNIYSLLGKNGAGKSTIMHLMLTFLLPDKGGVLYDGETYSQLPKKIKRNIGFLSEHSSLLEELTLSQYLKFSAQLYALDSSLAKRRADDLVDFFFDEKPEKKRISAFSTGMKKMAGICAAILHEPDLLILDEPFSGLDIFAAKKVIQLLEEYRNEKRTILISSHNLNYLNKITTDVLILKDKSIVFDAPLTELSDNNTEALESQFLEFFPDENNAINLQ